MRFTRALRVVSGVVVTGALLFGSAPVASADEIRDDQWPLKAFDAEAVWKESTGKGVKVAVLDHSVQGDHPDLKGNVLPGKKIETGGPANIELRENHGTAMAALIAGHGHGPGGADGVKGLAPDAKILPVDFFRGDTEYAVRNGFAEALRYAVDEGASVVNMSIDILVLTDEQKEAIAYALKKDVLLVSSAGNEGDDELDALAAYPGVVGVGAVDKYLAVWEDSDSGPQLMLTAPGVYIRSAGANKPYRLSNGTSDSAAYVSGAAALLRSKFPDLTAGQVANRLVKTAGLPKQKKGLKLPDRRYGYGFIRPYTALTADIPAGSKNGPLKMPEAPSAGANGPDGSDGKATQSGAKLKKPKSGLGTGVVVGIAVGGLAVIAIIVVVIVVVRRGNRRNGPPPGGPGGPGGWGGPGAGAPGFPQQQPGQYPPQPGAYQQPAAPGYYPPGPPQQPPGQ
ncbi:S8 family serine peptidase [Streptomyces sp. NPDC048639]|uniref:S8 family serine peptidase n=1 Tax=Streptomyces sp. NPDC048639 TaxID=3365581 RepID=UPI0037216C48